MMYLDGPLIYYCVIYYYYNYNYYYYIYIIVDYYVVVCICYVAFCDDLKVFSFFFSSPPSSLSLSLTIWPSPLE